MWSSGYLAIGWEMWARSRRTFNWLVLGTTALAVVYSLAAELLHTSAVLRALSYLPMVIAFFALFTAFNYTESDRRGRLAGYPQRLFAFPVRTWALVTCPMMCGIGGVILLYVVWAQLVYRPAGITVPCWPLGILICGMICYQSVVWALAGFRLIRLIALGVVGTGLAVSAVGFLPASENTFPIPLNILKTGLATLAAGAYGVALVAIGSQRRGGGRGRGWWRSRIEAFQDALPRRRRPFANGLSAQFWYEWRRNGVVLPFCVGFFLLLILGPLSWLAGRDPRVTLVTLCWIVGMPIGLAAVIGKGFAKPDIWTFELSLPVFMATRPLSDGALVLMKVGVAAVSAVISWAMVLVAIPVWFLLWGDGALLKQPLAVFRTLYGNVTFDVIVAVVFGCFCLLTWKLLIGSCYQALSGRTKWFVMGIGFNALCIVGLPVVFLVFVRNPDDLRDIQDAWPKFMWLLSVLFVGKITLAAWAWHDAYRRELISYRALARYLVFWLAATVCLAAVTALICPCVPWIRRTIFLVALLQIPVGRVGLAMRALAANRHQ